MSIEATSRKLALAGIDHTVVIAADNSPNIIRHDDPASFAKAYTRWVIDTSGASGSYTRVLAGLVQAIIDELEKAKNTKMPGKTLDAVAKAVKAPSEIASVRASIDKSARKYNAADTATFYASLSSGGEQATGYRKMEIDFRIQLQEDGSWSPKLAAKTLESAYAEQLAKAKKKNYLDPEAIEKTAAEFYKAAQKLVDVSGDRVTSISSILYAIHGR
jgi:hypothetical protein